MGGEWWQRGMGYFGRGRGSSGSLSPNTPESGEMHIISASGTEEIDQNLEERYEEKKKEYEGHEAFLKERLEEKKKVYGEKHDTLLKERLDEKRKRYEEKKKQYEADKKYLEGRFRERKSRDIYQEE